jgi:hypothetical protein
MCQQTRITGIPPQIPQEYRNTYRGPPLRLVTGLLLPVTICPVGLSFPQHSLAHLVT